MRGTALRHYGLHRLALLVLAAACLPATFAFVQIAPATDPAATAPSIDPARATQPLSAIAGIPIADPRPSLALSDHPRVRERYDAAIELIEDRKFEDALAEIERAMNLASGDCYELLYLSAYVKARLGRFGEARTAAEFAALLRPGAADVHYLLADLYQRMGDEERVVAHLRTVTLAADRELNNPRVTAAWFRLGEWLEQRGQLAAAAEAYAEYDQSIFETQPEHKTAEDVAPIVATNPLGGIPARVNIYRKLGRPADALRVAQDAADARPDDAALARLLAETLLDAGKPEQALEFCQARLAGETGGSPGDSPFLGLALSAARRAGLLDSWLGDVERQLGAGGGVALAIGLASRLQDDGDAAAAVRVWRLLAEARPARADIAWALAAAQKTAGDLAGAIQTLAASVRSNPSDADLPEVSLVSWMRSFAATDEFLHMVERLAGGAERDFATDFVLATSASAAGQFELAERLFASSAEKRGDFASTHVAWGRMLAARYRWDDAAQHAEAALKIAPSLPSAHFLLAEVRDGLDDAERTETTYLAALRYARSAEQARVDALGAAGRRERIGPPADAACALALGRYHRRAGELISAQRYFQEALEADPLCGEALEELVESYIGGGKLEVARDQARRAERSAIPPDVLRRVNLRLRFAAAPFQAEHLAELRRQLDEFPNDALTALSLASGLYFNERFDEAYEVLERAHAQDSADARFLFLLGRSQFARLDFDGAIATFGEIVRRYPNRVAALAELARTQIVDFRMDEGRKVLRRLLALRLPEEQQMSYRKQLLGSHLELSEFDDALAELDAWAKAEPQNDGVALARMQTLILAGRVEAALSASRERLRPAEETFAAARRGLVEAGEKVQANPDDRGAKDEFLRARRALDRAIAELLERREELARLCMDAKRFDVIEPLARRWWEENADIPALGGLLIEVLLAESHGADALKVADALGGRTPDAAVTVRLWRARALVADGRLPEALELLDALLEEQPIAVNPVERREVRQQIVSALVEAGRFDDAQKRCEQWQVGAAAQDPWSQREVLTFQRFIAQAAERTDEYIAACERLLELSPFDEGICNDLGYTLLEHGRGVERAEQLIRRAVAAQPLNAAFLDSLGWLRYVQGDFAAARELLARSVRLREGQDAALFDHLGDAEFRLGDQTAAQRAWQRALTLLEDQVRAGEPAGRRLPAAVSRDAALLASLRGKVDALAQGRRPAVGKSQKD